MSLKTVLETLEGVDDALKPFYTEKDDKFILQIEGVDNHPEVANLKTAYEAEKAKRTKQGEELAQAKSKLETMPEDFDLKAWEKAKSGDADEAKLVALRKELETKISEADKRALDAEGKLTRVTLDRDLNDALTEAGVTNPAYAKAARAMLSSDINVGENGAAFVETDMGPVGLVDHVKRWVAGEGKDFVTPAKGGGAKGSENGTSTTVNPWDAKTLNLTKQAEILKTDPALARQLQERAGA